MTASGSAPSLVRPAETSSATYAPVLTTSLEPLSLSVVGAFAYPHIGLVLHRHPGRRQVQADSPALLDLDNSDRPEPQGPLPRVRNLAELHAGRTDRMARTRAGRPGASRRTR